MAPEERKTPSLAVFIALAILAIGLVKGVALSSALLGSALVYLGVKILGIAYHLMVERLDALTGDRAQQEFLERVQREAEIDAQRSERKAPAVVQELDLIN